MSGNNGRTWGRSRGSFTNRANKDYLSIFLSRQLYITLFASPPYKLFLYHSPIGLSILRDIESNMCCFAPKSYTSRTCITYGGKRALWTPNLLELAVLHQSLGVVMANIGVFWKGKFQQRFFSKYTWKMAFLLSRIRSGTLRTLCEPKDVGYSCDFSKNSPNPGFWYNTYWTLYHVV